MKDKEYQVNTSFTTGDGKGIPHRMYSSGQTLSQVEYNMLPPNVKIHCSEKFSFGFDGDNAPVKINW